MTALHVAGLDPGGFGDDPRIPSLTFRLPWLVAAAAILPLVRLGRHDLAGPSPPSASDWRRVTRP